jgi:hypothetical protein
MWTLPVFVIANSLLMLAFGASGQRSRARSWVWWRQ